MEVLKVAYKKRKRRHKTKWNYKRIVIASTGLAVLVIALTVVISISGKDKSKDSSYNSGIVADAAQNQSDKDNNLNTIPQKTNADDKQDNTNAVSNDNVNTPTQNVNPTNQAENNDMTSKTSKGYSITEVDGITYVDGVLIANKTYALPADYNPGAVDGEVMEAFSVMQNAAAREGLNIYISSGFRSYETQNRLYNNYVAKDGKAEADRYSARAGHSEHHPLRTESEGHGTVPADILQAVFLYQQADGTAPL